MLLSIKTQKENHMSASKPKHLRLTRWVKNIINVVWYLNILSITAWPIVALIVGFNIPSDPSERHTDLNLFMGFTVNPEAVTTGTAPASMHGQGEMFLNNTNGLLAWWVSALAPMVMGIIVLSGVFQLRKIFKSLAQDKPFTQEIPARIKKLGFIIVLGSIAYPMLQYLVGYLVLQDINFTLTNIELFPSFAISPGILITGLACIVFSRVLLEATTNREELELTI